jgi:hypothetical protein
MGLNKKAKIYLLLLILLIVAIIIVIGVYFYISQTQDTFQQTSLSAKRQKLEKAIYDDFSSQNCELSNARDYVSVSACYEAWQCIAREITLLIPEKDVDFLIEATKEYGGERLLDNYFESPDNEIKEGEVISLIINCSRNRHKEYSGEDYYEIDFPRALSNYELSNFRKDTEDCNYFDPKSQSDSRGLNLSSGEICVKSYELDYLDKNSNQGVFIHIVIINKGMHIYREYLTAMSRPANIGKLGVYRLESHELWWYYKENQIILSREYIRVPHENGFKYDYEKATGDNPATQWFIGKFPPN